MIRIKMFESDGFITLNVDEIMYYRQWKSEKGTSATYGTIVYFKNGHDIKLDITEAQFMDALAALGVTTVG